MGDEENPILAMIAEKESLTPKKGEGFNLVGVDDFQPPGEALYLVAHYDSRAEAEDALKERAAKDPEEVLYVYGED